MKDMKWTMNCEYEAVALYAVTMILWSFPNDSAAEIPEDWVERIDKDVLRQGLEQENSQTSLDESVYQGDIELDEAWPGSLDDDSGAVSLLPSGRLEEKQFWMDHVYGIPYEIGPHFRPAQTGMIVRAMDRITEKTLGCIRFRLRADENDYIFFQKHVSSCTSKVGHQGGKQSVSLTGKCTSGPGYIEHEIMHALGIYHEQSRPDRDGYVEIITANIKPEMLGNFEMLPEMKAYNTVYDIASVMHYGFNDFAIDPELPTILPIAGKSVKMGQREGMSELDAVKLMAAYKCSFDGRDGYPVFPSLLPSQCDELYQCTAKGLRQNCTGAAFLTIDMLFACEVKQGSAVISKAKALGVAHMLHLQIKESVADSDFFTLIKKDVVALTVDGCKLRRLLLRDFDLANLIGYGIWSCNQLEVLKNDFESSPLLRFIEFYRVTFTSIERDAFSSLSELEHLSLEYYERDENLTIVSHSESITRLHCSCDYLWLRQWTEMNPSIVAPKTASEAFAMKVPYWEFQNNKSISRWQVYVPMDCASQYVNLLVNSSETRFTVNDPCTVN